MAIVNKHPTKNLKVDNENSYLFNYLDTLGLDIEVHNCLLYTSDAADE